MVMLMFREQAEASSRSSLIVALQRPAAAINGRSSTRSIDGESRAIDVHHREETVC